MKSSCASYLAEKLRVETPYGPVIVPSAGTYRSIFGWDSGWNSFWLKTIGTDEAAAELRTLFRTAKPDGRIPHETVFDEKADYSLMRRLQLFLLKNTFDGDGASVFIDPPVYLWSAAELAAGGSLPDEDACFFKEASAAKIDWLIENRTVKDLPEPFCSLPLILHPLESGTDLSPAFDRVYGGLPRLLLSLLSVQRGLKPEDWSLCGRIPEKPVNLIFDLSFISFFLLALERTGRLKDETAAAFMDSFYDPAGKKFDFWYLHRGELRRAENPSFSSVLPFLTDICDKREAASAVERHCLPGGTFRRGRLPSFNPESRSRRSRHLWRGSCSWMNMNYCCFLLLKKYGFVEEAAALSEDLRKAAGSSGFAEYLDAFTLEPGGASGFSWNGLLDCMNPA